MERAEPCRESARRALRPAKPERACTARARPPGSTPPWRPLPRAASCCAGTPSPPAFRTNARSNVLPIGETARTSPATAPPPRGSARNYPDGVPPPNCALPTPTPRFAPNSSAPSYPLPNPLPYRVHRAKQMDLDGRPRDPGGRFDLRRRHAFQEVQQKHRALPLRKPVHHTPHRVHPLASAGPILRRSAAIGNPGTRLIQFHRTGLHAFPELKPAGSRDIAHQIDRNLHQPRLHARLAA